MHNHVFIIVINEELKRYFEENIKKGYSFEQLADLCKQQGYSQNDIDSVKAYLNISTKNVTKTNINGKKKKKFTWLLIVFILLTIIGGLAFYFYEEIENVLDIKSDDKNVVNDTFPEEIVDEEDLRGEIDVNGLNSKNDDINYFTIAENGSLIINEDENIWALGEYKPTEFEYRGRNGLKGILVEYEKNNEFLYNSFIIDEENIYQNMLDKDDTVTIILNGKNYLFSLDGLIWETEEVFDVINLDLGNIIDVYNIDSIMTETEYEQLLNDIETNEVFKAITEKFPPKLKDYSELGLKEFNQVLNDGNNIINMGDSFKGIAYESYLYDGGSTNSYVFITFVYDETVLSNERDFILDTNNPRSQLVTEKENCNLVWARNVNTDKITYDNDYDIAELTNGKYHVDMEKLELNSLSLSSGEKLQTIFDCNLYDAGIGFSNTDVLEGEFDVFFDLIEGGVSVSASGIVILNSENI